MKNISPISPVEEIVPEQNNQAPALVATSEPVMSQPVEAPIPVSEPENPQVPVALRDTPITNTEPIVQPAQTQNLYPEPLSFVDRQHEPARNTEAAVRPLGMPFSQYLIPPIAGLFALWGIVELVRSLAGSTAFSLLGGSDELLGGSVSRYILVMNLFAGVQCILLLILSYKIFRGSKLALALLTGPAAIYLQAALLPYVMLPSIYLNVAFSSPKLACLFIGQVALVGLFILAWTKDRPHYYK